MSRALVVGLGYVGITLTVALARKGFTVYGHDKNPETVSVLASGRPHLFEPGVAEGLRAFLNGTIHIADRLPSAPVDAAIICVSTPVVPATRQPDLDNLRAAARAVAAECAPTTLVIVRSTVPVGASRQIVLPELTARWGRARLAFCPERTIQGQALRELEQLPQVVGGLDAESCEMASGLFARLTSRVVPVSSLEAAEAVKLVNNCHTDLIYSFGNEVALLAERLALDPLELIRAANVDYPRPDLSKPGFVGGGCLSKDPYILIASSRAAGYEPRLVGRARDLNEYLPLHVARRFVELIRQTRGAVAGSVALLLGFAYKGWPPTDDMRGAPVLPMLDVLRGEGLVLRGHDFLVASDTLGQLGVTPVTLEEGFAGADAALVISDHPEYAKQDLPRLLDSMRRPAVLYDCWRVLDAQTVRAGGLRYASIGYG